MYAKYTENHDITYNNTVSFGAMFLQAFGIPTSGEGAINPGLFEGGGGALATSTDAGTEGALAYINYIFYDKNFEDAPLAGFARTTSSAGNAFEKLELNFTAEKEGYLFVYVSNEEPVAPDVYFDDLQIVHTPTVLVQTDSYYPFGLSHGNMSYVREGSQKTSSSTTAKNW